MKESITFVQEKFTRYEKEIKCKSLKIKLVLVFRIENQSPKYVYIFFLHESIVLHKDRSSASDTFFSN